MRPLINAGNDAACGLLFTDERGEAFKFFFPPHLLYHLCRLQGEKINAFVIKWRGKNCDKVLAHGGLPPTPPSFPSLLHPAEFALKCLSNCCRTPPCLFFFFRTSCDFFSLLSALCPLFTPSLPPSLHPALIAGFCLLFLHST